MVAGRGVRGRLDWRRRRNGGGPGPPGGGAAAAVQRQRARRGSGKASLMLPRCFRCCPSRSRRVCQHGPAQCHASVAGSTAAAAPPPLVAHAPAVQGRTRGRHGAGRRSHRWLPALPCSTQPAHRWRWSGLEAWGKMRRLTPHAAASPHVPMPPPPPAVHAARSRHPYPAQGACGARRAPAECAATLRAALGVGDTRLPPPPPARPHSGRLVRRLRSLPDTASSWLASSHGGRSAC